jgi:hypothetical protein
MASDSGACKGVDHGFDQNLLGYDVSSPATKKKENEKQCVQAGSARARARGQDGPRRHGARAVPRGARDRNKKKDRDEDQSGA